MKIDPSKYPTLYKAYKLEQEANTIRSSEAYRQEAHKYFSPEYSKDQVEKALKEIEKYTKTHLSSCSCDGACHYSPTEAYHIIDEVQKYDRAGEGLGIPPKYNIPRKPHPSIPASHIVK